jgi:hypothetical protein
MISIENKLSKLSKDNLQKICKMMKKKHMQDDSKQRLMEILMKPLGKKYKISSWFYGESSESPESSEPRKPRVRPESPRPLHLSKKQPLDIAPAQPRYKKPRVQTPPSRREKDRLDAKSAANIAYLNRRDAERNAEMNAAISAETLLLTRQEIAMNIIILFKYYRLGQNVLENKVLNGFIQKRDGIDNMMYIINLKLYPIQDTINTIVHYLEEYVSSHMTYNLLVKTNNIVIQQRNKNKEDFFSHLVDLDNKLGKGTLKLSNPYWLENLLDGTFNNFWGRFIPI